MSRGAIVFAFNAMRVGGSQSVILELVRAAAAAGFAPVVASRRGRLAPQFLAAGAQVVPLLMREGTAADRGPLSVVKTVVSFGAVTQIATIRRGQPILVHASQPWPVAFAAMACLSRRAPLIWHAHGTTAVEIPPAWLPLVQRASAAWVGVTPEVEEGLRALRPRPSTNVMAIPSPIRVDIAERERARPEPGIVGIASTLTANKADYVRTCLSAAATITANKRHLTVLVVGEGPERPALEDFAAHVTRDQPALNVKFLGASPRPWELLRPATVIVGMGLVALEAAVRGHAVVAASNYGLGGRLTLGSYESLSRTNFTGRGIRPLDARLLAEDIAAAIGSGRDPQIASHVRQERGPQAVARWVDLWSGLMP
jgi:glycosyltransferase involved in cell wall biosynthesis